MEEEGIRGVLQAGSASFERVPPELDDGVCSTHFSYVWEERSRTTLRMIAAGSMPEMHVWVAIPRLQEIVDLTTGYQVKQCENLLGVDWLSVSPPKYLWSHVNEIEKIHYEPSLSAIELALYMLKMKPWGVN